MRFLFSYNYEGETYYAEVIVVKVGNRTEYHVIQSNQSIKQKFGCKFICWMYAEDPEHIGFDEPETNEAILFRHAIARALKNYLKEGV